VDNAGAEKAAAELKHPEGQKTRSKIVRLIVWHFYFGSLKFFDAILTT
jgi:hypothetical protein